MILSFVKRNIFMLSKIIMLTCSVTLLGGGFISAKANPQVEWEKTLNFPTQVERFQAVQLIQQDPNGGYITATMSGNLITVWQIKPSGELNQKVGYRSEGLRDLRFFKQMNDGSYLLSGYRSTPPLITQFYTIHLSKNGEKLWETKENTDMAEETPDNGYVLVKNNGPTRYSPDPLNDVVLTKVDQNGNTEWVHNIEKPNGIDVIVFDTHRTNDGATAITGKYEWWTGTELKVHLYLAKIDDKGNLLWELQHDTGRDTYALSVTETKDGDLIAAGDDGHFRQPSPEHSGYLLKVDKDGRPIWEKRYNADSKFQDIELMKNGHYLVAGAANYHLFNNYSYAGDEYVQEIAPSGNVVWSSITEGADQILRDGNAIRQAEDGGYLAVGSSYTSAEGVRAVHLTKLHRGNDPTVPVPEQAELKLDSEDYSLSVGQTLDTVLRSVYNNQQSDVTKYGSYSMNDPSTASVDELGNITGRKKGQTVLTATYNGIQTKANVYVYGDVTKMETGLKLDSEEYSLMNGQTLDTVVTLVKDGKTSIVHGRVTYSLSDASVASIDSAGNITGLKRGAAELTASYNGMKTTAKIFVY